MYEVHTSGFCCDTGGFSRVHVCVSLLEALATFHVYSGDDWSDGPSAAAILRADGSRVDPTALLPLPADAILGDAKRALERGDLRRAAGLMHEMADTLERVAQGRREEVARFDAMAGRAYARVHGLEACA